MIYFVVVILVLLAIWIAVYITRRIINKNNQRKAAAARRHDPEAAVSEVGAAPTFRETAIDVNERIFGRGRGPFAESDEDAYRRRQEMYGRRSSDLAGRREGVRRAEDGEADGELPTYQESHKMPKAPAAAYDASQVHSTSQRNSAEQAMASQQPDIAPPGYSTSETPIVRRL